jgi:LacI family transcriptional regulator
MTASSRHSASLPLVLLALPADGDYCRGVLQGIADYVQEHGPWRIRRHEGRLDSLPAAGRRRKLSGVISVACDARTLAPFRRTGAAVVFVEVSPLTVPQVLPDDVAIGRLAGEHLLSLGLRSLAFVTNLDAELSVLRCRGLQDAAAAHGVEVRSFLDNIHEPDHDPKAIFRWLGTLPAPTGLFATPAGTARNVLDRLHILRRRVPEDIALLSSTLDPLGARLCYPSLSSIDMSTRAIGYRAAEILDRTMHGAAPPAEPIRIAPTRVIERMSTDILAVKDEDLRRALGFIRRHACDGITVADLLEEIPISRRRLEQKFRLHLNRTIHREIVRVRLEEAKRLLAETSLPLPDIAVRVGYEFASNLCQVFRRELNASPSDFRERRPGG